MSDAISRLPLRCVVVGCGPIGRLHAEAIAAHPRATLDGLVDLDARRASDLAGQFGGLVSDSLAPLLQNAAFDVAFIATPNQHHVAPCTDALQSGLHVFCEKPLATDAGDAAGLVEFAVKQKRFLGVDYNRRYGFGYRQAKRWIDDGRIGRIRGATFHVSDGMPRPHVATEPTVMLSALLVHHIDLIRWFVGEPDAVYCQASPARGGTIREVSLAFTHREAVTEIAGRYREGQTRTSERLTLDGETGEIVVEDVNRRAILRGADADVCEERRPSVFEEGDGFYATIRRHIHAFLNAVVAETEPEVTGRDGLIGIKIAAAARQSLAEGAPVRLPAAGE